MENIRLFAYKMTHDTGFAPNPFHAMLTLANCKPCIRKYKKTGDWIAGFTSRELNGDDVGKEKLVYLMKVTGKIPYNEYWNNPLYKLKKPNLQSSQVTAKTGDNIYKPNNINAELYTDFEQIPNKNHYDEEAKILDISGKYVLISECFYYFGSKPLKIDKEIKPCIPKGQSAHGARTQDTMKAKRFIRYIQSNYKVGIHNMPHDWPEDIKTSSNACKKCR
jgi:hypothetical protein